MYTLRCAPSFRSTATLALYDQEIRGCLENILNVELHEKAWDQSSLPAKQEGIGIGKASDLALPAFISSAYGATNTVKKLLPDFIDTDSYQELLDARNAWAFILQDKAEQPSNLSVQALWDAPMYKKKYQDLLESETSPVDRARLLAVAAEHSSDWLSAIPVPALGLKLDNMSLRIATGLRLGSSLCQPYKCKCGDLVDTSGRHGLSCKNAKGTFSRHQQVNDLLKRALGSAQATAILEPPGLARKDGKRPDGLTLIPWSRGRSLVWDYTCRDTLAQSNITATSKEAGKAAEKAEKDKAAHYQELCSSYIVMPVAMETMGAWGQQGLKFVKEIGERIATATGDKRATYFLFQAISMAVQRGNVASIAGSIPKSKSLDEPSYL